MRLMSRFLLRDSVGNCYREKSGNAYAYAVYVERTADSDGRIAGVKKKATQLFHFATLRID